MKDDAGRLRIVRPLALVVGLLSLLVVALSAYLRLDAAGLGCANWPDCYGRVLVDVADVPASRQYGLSRLIHRLVASADLVLTCILVWYCLRPRPLPSVSRPAVMLLLLTLGLSVLGIFTAHQHYALVGFFNIVGGFGLVIVSWRVVNAAKFSSIGVDMPGSRPAPALLGIGGATLALTIVAGAWIGATYSAIACPSLPACGGVWWPPAEGWAALNPLLTPVAAPPPGNAGGISLHLLHRGLALMAMLALGAAAVSGLRQRASRRAAGAVLLFLMLAWAFGTATVLSDLALWVVVGHGVSAALLLAALAGWSRR